MQRNIIKHCDSALIASFLYVHFFQRPHVTPPRLVQMPLTTHVLNDAYRVLGARAQCAVAAQRVKISSKCLSTVILFYSIQQPHCVASRPYTDVSLTYVLNDA